MAEFNEHMAIVEKIDKKIKDYLLSIGYSKWPRVHAQVNRTWMMTSNIAESVNSKIRHAKVLTIVHLLEFMSQLVQKWKNNNKSKATFSGFYLEKKYEKILRRNITALEKLRVRKTNEYVYTVVDDITPFTMKALGIYHHTFLKRLYFHHLESGLLVGQIIKREDGFKKSKITCSNCGQQEHNMRTCKNVTPQDKE